MKGLKLTPFLLFVLLLLVLVFAMLFGSSTNKVMEGLAPGTSNFTAATTATYSDTTMDVVYNDGIQIYYDKSNGNIVIPSTTDGEYTLITRGGTNSNTTSDSYTSGGNVSSTTAAPATYTVNGYTIMYIAYEYKTVIIVSQGTALKQMYKVSNVANNVADATGRVMSLNGMSSLTDSVQDVTPVTPAGPEFSSVDININGGSKTVFQLQSPSGVLPGIYYNLDQGLIVGSSGDGSANMSTSKDYVDGTSVQVSGSGMVIV